MSSNHEEVVTHKIITNPHSLSTLLHEGALYYMEVLGINIKIKK
jgi:hypothetical protein